MKGPKPAPGIRVTSAGPGDYQLIEELMREYVAWLPFDVTTFQDFEREMADIELEYGPPSGFAYLAYLHGEPVGVVGVREIDESAAELKRMWVQPAARRHGIGAIMVRAAGYEALAKGYRYLRLDTVTGAMDAANRLYERMGFVDIESYRHNPLPDARFMELDLRATME